MTPPFQYQNHHLFIALLWVALFLSGCAVPGRPSMPDPESDPALRLITWNIQWFPGRSPRASEHAQDRHREAVRPYLASLRPDILVLQEIRDEEAAQFLVDSVPGLDLHVVSSFVREDPDHSQQIVIASRYPARAGFAEVFTDIYSSPDVEPYRGYAFAALEAPFGGTLLVYAVHLKSNLGVRDENIQIRESSAQQILNHLAVMKEHYAEYGPISVVVAGDFNVMQERPEMAHERTLDLFKEYGFHWTWQGVPFRRRITWPEDGRFPNACFDHILTMYLPQLTAHVIPKPEGQLSDHRPVLLRIPWPDHDQ